MHHGSAFIAFILVFFDAKRADSGADASAALVLP
jgi:hypothetical protein